MPGAERGLMNDNNCTHGLTVMSYCVGFDMDRRGRPLTCCGKHKKLVKPPKGRREGCKPRRPLLRAVDI